MKKQILSLVRVLMISVCFLTLPLISTAQGRIAFTSERDGNYEIYVMNPDGSNQTRLTNNPDFDGMPAYSFDGRKIAFVSGSGAFGSEIYVMNADGTNKNRLTNNVFGDFSPAFSPDGSKIVFLSTRDGTYDLYLMNSHDGSNQTRLTNSPELAKAYPSFSPDGSKIVYRAVDPNGNGNGQIFVTNSDGTNQTNLSNSVFSDDDPAFSPDGSKIAFASNRIGQSEIYVMNANGSNQTRLTISSAQDIFPSFSPDGSKIAFVSNNQIHVMNSNGTNKVRVTNNSSSDSEPTWGRSTRPVLIIPGIAGTYAASTSSDLNWLMNRGVPPSKLQVDPIARVYHDLITTFENLGYVRDKDLFVVNYDWRVPPGPLDGSIDGVVSNISATSISDEQFEYGVDYLGLALRRAYERWETDHPGQPPLGEVDIVAHSTGGLVARTYIQSPAYNAAFAVDKNLPRVKNMIMVGVPNRGASKAWNPLHDNWNADLAYKYVLAKIINRAFKKVADYGQTIPGPDHVITRASILDADGNPDHVKFINQYVPTIRSLLGTYDFADLGAGYTNVNSDPAFSNDWVLDLNDGLDLLQTSDPSPFANECEPTVIYTGGQLTPGFVRKILTGGEDVVFNFDDVIFSDDVPAGTPWFEDIPSFTGGDGTVPLISSTGQFIGDSRVTLREVTFGGPDHTHLMSNVDAQATILETIGRSFSLSDIHTGAAVPQVGAIVSVISDPVDGFVVDGAGRRLGYSEATGPITEIPGSVWFGDADGAGWIFGAIQEPLHIELTGRGEPYFFEVSVHTPNGDGGVADSGFLALGATRNLPIVIGGPQDTTPPVVAPSVIGTLGNNGWYTSNVGVSWTVTDAESGVSSQNGCEVQNVTADTAGVTFTCSATSGGGTASASVTIKRDATAPTLSPTVTPDPVLVGGTANASANASDNLSGLASQSCGTPDTSTAGAKSVGCSAADNAGNIGIANANYTVSNGGYNFSGFFQPVDNLPVLNEVKAGSAIPVKFSLGGNFGLNIFATGYPASGIIACNSSSPADVVEETVNAGGSSINYDAATGRYHYVWKTDQSWKGQCRMLIVKLKDGNTYIAQFRFK